MIPTRQENAEVLYARRPGAVLTRREIAALEKQARRNPRGRIRLCLHENPRAALHRMLILMPRGAYVRPHMHRKGGETYLFLSGRATAFVFDARGRVLKTLPVGDMRSGRIFLYEQQPLLYHGLRIESDYLAYLEVKAGPFRRSDTIFAPWAPSENDQTATRRFMSLLPRTPKGGR